MDNQIQIGHDTIIGKRCLIASQVGIAGCCNIGNDVTIWGQVGVSSDITVEDEVVVVLLALEYLETYYSYLKFCFYF